MVCEAAKVELLCEGKADDAMAQFRRAASLDATNVAALHGMLGCQLAMGHVAGQQAR
jgi:hypothetical protein